MTDEDNRRKLFTQKVLEKLHPVLESDPESDVSDKETKNESDKPRKIYTVLAPPPGVKLTEVGQSTKVELEDTDNTEETSNTDSDTSASISKTKRRRRHGKRISSQTPECVNTKNCQKPVENLTKNQKRKLKKKRRKAELKQDSKQITFIYTGLTEASLNS